MRRPPILIAAMHGNTAELQRLLEQQQSDNNSDNNNNNLVNAQDVYGWTPIMLASIHGHVKTVRLLLNQGADINHVNSFGNTALMCAGKRGHFAVVRLLLHHGATVSYASISEQTLTTAAAAVAAAASSSKKCKKNKYNNGTTMIPQHHCHAVETKKQPQKVDTMLFNTLVETMELLLLQNPTMREAIKTFLHEHTRDNARNAIQTELQQKGRLVKSVLPSLQNTEIVSTLPIIKAATCYQQHKKQQQQQQDAKSKLKQRQGIVEAEYRNERSTIRSTHVLPLNLSSKSTATNNNMPTAITRTKQE